MVKIAIDTMGGDNGPEAMIKGAIESLSVVPDTKLLLFGAEDRLRSILSNYQYDASRIEIVHAPDAVSLHESPVMAVRKKKNSSIVMGMNCVKEGNADAIISSGSTGAILAGGQLIVGRIKGIQRPPLGALMPTKKGISLLVDAGANVDCKSDWLVQFAEMGSIYVKNMLGIENPTVGLVNIGAEEEKGNALVKETMLKLKEKQNLNFIGSLEARDIAMGECDVIVADGFVGNVVLKMYEGVGKMFQDEITSALKDNGPITLFGAALVQGSIKKSLKKYSAKEAGGAPILGLRGLVVKVHGNTDGTEVLYAIKQASNFVNTSIVKKIADSIEDVT